MRDIGERAAVDEGGRTFERLHQVRRQRLLEQHGHGAVGLEVAGAHRFSDHAYRATTMLPRRFFEILEVAGETEDRHDFGGDRDVKTVFARKPIGDAAERADNGAQRAVVHVEHAAPGDAALVDAKPVAPIDVVVEHRGEQVFAEVMAWKSPVKCRLMSSIGTTWA